jgi:hypothetical protein
MVSCLLLPPATSAGAAAPDAAEGEGAPAFCGVVGSERDTGTTAVAAAEEEEEAGGLEGVALGTALPLAPLCAAAATSVVPVLSGGFLG